MHLPAVAIIYVSNYNSWLSKIIARTVQKKATYLVKSKRFYPYFDKKINVNVTEAKVGIKSFRFYYIAFVYCSSYDFR